MGCFTAKKGQVIERSDLPAPPQNKENSSQINQPSSNPIDNHPQNNKQEVKSNKPPGIKEIIAKLLEKDKDFENELNNSFFDDEDKFKDELNEFYQKFNKFFKSQNLTKSEVDKYVRETRITNYINNQCLFKNWNCHKLLSENIPTTFKSIPGETLQKFSQILPNFENFFPLEQSGLMYNFGDHDLGKFYSFKPKDLNKRLSNISEYKIEAINIRFCIEDLKEHEWISSLSEIIDKQKGLVTLVISIDSKDSHANITNLLNNFNLFVPVLQAIKNNKNIKVFALKSLIAKEIELSASICKELVEITECENISSFVVCRFVLPLSFINSIAMILPKNKNLKVVGIDNIKCDIPHMDKLVNCLAENTSLKVILLGGNKLPEDTLKKYQSLVMQNEVLNIFHYENS